MRQGKEDSEGIPTNYQRMLLARTLPNLCGCRTLETGVCRRQDEADEVELHGSEGRYKLQGVLEVASREEDRAWLKGSYIGMVHPSVDLAGIQNQLFSSNNFGCEIRSLGGRKVLISGLEEEGVERLLVEVDRRAVQWILVHITQLECINESMNIRVDGALFQIRVSKELVSSASPLYSEALALDGCKKIYPTLSLVVPFSPSHVEESIFNDQKESSAKPFLGMDDGINTKQGVACSKQKEQIRCSEKAESDRSQHATEEIS
ncbi:hypothetical protein Ancab_010155 [Ancistrocladus abbreviatus]